jgi:hypothetical protein
MGTDDCSAYPVFMSEEEGDPSGGAAVQAFGRIYDSDGGGGDLMFTLSNLDELQTPTARISWSGEGTSEGSTVQFRSQDDAPCAGPNLIDGISATAVGHRYHSSARLRDNGQYTARPQ